VTVVDVRGPAVPLTHHWSPVVGAGRAAEGLRADWQEQLATVHAELGTRYVRFHGLFHDDMFVYREVDDRPVLSFQYVDALVDRILDLGVRPFVELGFMPSDLATATDTVFWWHGNGSPPRDLDRWGWLVEQTTRHWVARYGLDEVLTWYFEVWNEPNLAPFWAGTRSQYFELYAVTARAVRSVHPGLRVGGPATSNFVPDARFAGETEDLAQHAAVRVAADLAALEWWPVWVEDFLAFCDSEGLPVDFVSSHPYPTDWALDEHGQGLRLTREVDATPKDLRRLREIVRASPFPAAEIHVTEWSSSSSSRDFTHDYLQAATFVVRSALRTVGLVDSLAYWTFTDVFEEQGAGDEPFHGGFGMLTLQGVTKPTFHAFRMLHALGDELVAEIPTGVVTRRGADGRVAGLFFHYPPEEAQTVPGSFDTRDVADATLALGSPLDIELTLTGLRPGARLTLEVLDDQHGDAMAAWRSLGSPRSPDRAHTAELRRLARATHREGLVADADGVLEVRTTLRPWAVASLVEELAPGSG
jgi:xylan 1,4-beta-xylosidase